MIKKTEKIWMDGRFVDWDNANVHVMTHTLHYGLGVFEGIRCYETKGGPQSSGSRSMFRGSLSQPIFFCLRFLIQRKRLKMR